MYIANNFGEVIKVDKKTVDGDVYLVGKNYTVCYSPELNPYLRDTYECAVICYLKNMNLSELEKEIANAIEDIVVGVNKTDYRDKVEYLKMLEENKFNYLKYKRKYYTIPV